MKVEKEEKIVDPIPTTSKQASEETKEALATSKDSKPSSDDEVQIVKDEAEEARIEKAAAAAAAEKKRQFKFNIAEGGFTEVYFATIHLVD